MPSCGGRRAFLWWHGSCLEAGHEALPLHAVPCHGTPGKHSQPPGRGGMGGDMEFIVP